MKLLRTNQVNFQHYVWNWVPFIHSSDKCLLQPVDASHSLFTAWILGLLKSLQMQCFFVLCLCSRAFFNERLQNVRNVLYIIKI